MAPELMAADCTQRLADQLQTLSEVAETLTFRLLELEERVSGYEVQLEPLLEGGFGPGSAIPEETELRLIETEDRLARLESLLKGIAEPGGDRHLRSHLRSVSPAGDPPMLFQQEAPQADLIDTPSDQGDYPEEAFLEDNSYLEEHSFHEDPALEHEQPLHEPPFHEQQFMDELSA